jgi:ABC-2 type transport system permease protein
MTSLRADLVLWRRLVGARARGQLQYRTSFAFSVAAAFGIGFVDFVEVLVLFGHFDALGGWTLPEIALLYGISGLGIAVADMVAGHFEDLHLDIRSGQFDVVLLRPAGTLLQVLSSDIAMRRIGRIAQAGAVLVYALLIADIPWTPARALFLVVGVAAAALVFAATFVLGSCITFWTVGSTEASNAFTYGGNYLTSYPLNIFGPWLRRAFALVVPLAFVTYFPGLYLLDKPDPLGYPEWVQFLAPFVACAYAAAVGRVWRRAVRHYRSTGS